VKFLVEFELNVPEGTPDSAVKERVDAAAGSAHLGTPGTVLGTPLAQCRRSLKGVVER
jgi:hypothetical protein